MKDLLVKVQREIENRGLSEDLIASILQTSPLIIARKIIYGYASVDIVDREGQRIPIPALTTAVPRFMENVFYRPVMVYHSDVQVGRILPIWTHPDTGELYQTHIDNLGWKVICEIRDDVEIGVKVWEEIIKGNLRSFSIAGASKDKLRMSKDGVHFEQVNDLDIYEVTICEIPVNSLSKFDVLWDPNRVSI